MSDSGVGWLIQAATGSFGGAGGRACPPKWVGYGLTAVRCWVCDELAHGVCRFCGRAVCKDHAKTKSFLFEAWSNGETLRGLAVQDALYCGVCNPRSEPVDLQFLLDPDRPASPPA